jgi:tetratricopeptide (TPR) repeat protein
MLATADDIDMCCASYGMAEADDSNIKLKECNGCDLIRNCSNKCQEKHRSQHERECKSRATGIRCDDILFRQPKSSHLGDCPICLLPLSLDTNKSIMQSCCSKLICIGCYYTSIKCEVDGRIGKRMCPFCRQPEPKTDADIEGYKKKRAEANDPVAIQEAGKRCYHDGDYERAFDHFTKVAQLGDAEAEAHFCLSFMYRDGKGVEKDVAKRLYHLEEAAIGGHPKARHNLGVHEVNQGRIERAVKHFIIAANNGHADSIKALGELHAVERVSREDFALALRAYKAFADATKSPQRDAAEAAMKILGKM